MKLAIAELGIIMFNAMWKVVKTILAQLMKCFFQILKRNADSDSEPLAEPENDPENDDGEDKVYEVLRNSQIIFSYVKK